MSVMGIHLPPFDAVLYTAGGYVAPPMVAGVLMTFVPDSMKGSAVTTWLVKAASVLLPAWLVGRFVSQRAGSYVLIGGAASFVIDAVNTFAPGLIPGLRGMGYQPLLGSYFGPQLPAYTRRSQTSLVRGRSAMSPMIADAPERLDPSGRF
jgi:hypothetical protein